MLSNDNRVMPLITSERYKSCRLCLKYRHSLPLVERNLPISRYNGKYFARELFLLFISFVRMTFLKIIAIINWVFAGIWGIGIIYLLFQPETPTDAAGQGQLAGIKILGVIALLLLVGLNWLPHYWSRIIAFAIGLLLMYIVWGIAKDA